MEFTESSSSAPNGTPGVFFGHGGMFPGGIAVSVMLGTYALLDGRPSVPLLVLAFCGTALIYQLDRSLGFSPEDRHNRPDHWKWTQAHRGYVWSTVLLLAVAGGAMLPRLRPMTIGIGMGLGGLGLLHVVPVLGQRRRLKSFWRVKPFAISATWALGGVLLPVIEAGRAITMGVVALAAYRFVIVLVNTLLADWGDRRGDARAGLRTMATEWTTPVLFGVARGLLGITLAGGLVVAAGYRLPLLLVDLVGVVGMLMLAGRIETRLTQRRRLALDLVVAWPLVTALMGWLIGRW